MGAPEVEMVRECPSCGADVYDDDRFCEACGSDLPAASAAAGTGDGTGDGPTTAATAPAGHPADGEPHACGGTFRGGWCDTCGTRAPDARDHIEVELGRAAGVTDRGLRHHRNEDAMALADAPGGVVAVVADGVSATVDPQEASATTVVAALEVLEQALADPAVAADDALVAAHAAAVEAVGGLEWTPRPDLGAPSCTFLAGMVPDKGPIWVASLGDCRAYWLDDQGIRLLTVDDSWAAEQVRAGAMTERQADADPRAHVITRWVGEDAESDWGPRLTRHDVGEGRLLLCTDGLWNHLASEHDLALLVNRKAPPLEVASSLARFANDAGGHDNVTVVVIDRTSGSSSPDDPTPTPDAPEGSS